MNNMDKQYIEQHGIVGKYLQGQLTGEESTAFEEYLMDNPHMVEQLELDQLMTQAMPAAFSQLQQDKQTKPRSFWWWLQNPLSASFATMVVCVLCFPLVSHLFMARDDDPSVIANPPQVYLAPVRGELEQVQMPVILIGNNDRLFELTIQPSDYSATQYEIEIKTIDSDNVTLVAQPFEVMPSGDIKLLLPAKFYLEGKYQLTAKPINSSAAIERFYFTVKR